MEVSSHKNYPSNISTTLSIANEQLRIFKSRCSDQIEKIKAILCRLLHKLNDLGRKVCNSTTEFAGNIQRFPITDKINTTKKQIEGTLSLLPKIQNVIQQISILDLYNFMTSLHKEDLLEIIPKGICNTLEKEYSEELMIRCLATISITCIAVTHMLFVTHNLKTLLFLSTSSIYLMKKYSMLSTRKLGQQIKTTEHDLEENNKKLKIGEQTIEIKEREIVGLNTFNSRLDQCIENSFNTIDFLRKDEKEKNTLTLRCRDLACQIDRLQEINSSLETNVKTVTETNENLCTVHHKFTQVEQQLRADVSNLSEMLHNATQENPGIKEIIKIFQYLIKTQTEVTNQCKGNLGTQKEVLGTQKEVLSMIVNLFSKFESSLSEIKDGNHIKERQDTTKSAE